MRISKWCLVFLTLLGVTLAGCSFLDSLTGVKDTNGDGRPDTQEPGGGIFGGISQIGSAMPGWIGWGFALLGSLGTVYGRIRTKQAMASGSLALDLGTSVVRGIDMALGQGNSAQVTKEALYKAIQDLIAKEADDPERVKALIAQIKAAARGGD